MDEYSSLGMKRAVDSLGVPKDRLDAHAVRAWINDHVRADGLFLATVADFWLLLNKDVAQKRRGQSPPINPWQDRDLVPRTQVQQWHAGWIERLGVEAQDKALAGKQDSVSVRLLTTLRQKHPWLVCTGLDRPKRKYTKRVVGFIDSVPARLLDRAYATDTVDIEFLTLAQALRRDWLDRDERGIWLKALSWLQAQVLDEQRQAYATEYAELARLALKDHTGT